MRNIANPLIKCCAALFAACWLSGVSSAAAPSRLNPAFLNYAASLSSSSSSALPLKPASYSAAGTGRALGWRPSPVDLSHLAGRDVSRPLAERKGVLASGARPVFPATYDLRSYGKLTAIRDQGAFGDCWAFATYASMESNLLTSETRDFSENNMAMNSGFDWSIYEGGNSSISTAYLARWNGPVNQADDANDGGLRPGLPVQKHAQEAAWLPPPGAVNELAFKNSVKAAVTGYGAVYSSIYWDDNASKQPNDTAYYNSHCTAPFGTGGTCTCIAGSCGGHAIALVGWNDSYAASNFAAAPPGPGAFLARNSWGASTGDAGYFYISYYDTSLGGDNAVFYAPETTANYTDVYQYDRLGYSSDLGSEDAGGPASGTEWMSNIFTASGPGYLKAAGFYTTDVNAAYVLYVYTGVTAGSPRSGTLAYTASGSFSLPGYHTLAFGSNVVVAAGQKFSVVVKLTNPAYNYPVAVERPIPDYSSLAAASAGQSYFSADGASWTDMTSLWANTNVCLKAYANTDLTPPSNIVTVNDGLGADISQTGSYTELSANWTGSADAESGLVSYLYAIGTSLGNTSVTGGWLDNGLSLSVTKTGLNLADGTPYYFGVKAVNGVGLASTPKWSDGQTVNTAFPTDIAYVHDGLGADADYVSSKNRLSANWASSSFSAGTIDHYYYAIGSAAGGADIVPWTDLGPAAYSYTRSGLPALTEGQKYYVSVRAYNNLGNSSNVSTSDGQTVDVTSPTAKVVITSPLPAANGPFAARLELTEAGAVFGTPALKLAPGCAGGTAMDMTYAVLSTWTASSFIESYFSTGTACFVFSAVDGAGNTGSLLTAGASFNIDPALSGVSGGIAANSDGASVFIPAGAYGGSLYVSISTIPASRTEGADSSSYDSVRVHSSELSREFKARSASGAPVTVFARPLTLTLAYPDANGDGRIDGDFIKEDQAWLYYLDEASGKWTPLSGVVRDAAANTVTAPVSHFSVYSVRTLAASGLGLSGLKAFPNPCDFRSTPSLYIAGMPLDALDPRVYIYNEAAELVRTLTPGTGIDGLNVANWDGRLSNGAKAASGLYIYLVKTGNYGKGKGKVFIIW